MLLILYGKTFDRFLMSNQLILLVFDSMLEF